jgi:hypothetical protein
MKRRFAGRPTLRGDLDRGGAVVRVEAAIETRRRHFDQSLAESDHRLVGEACEDDVLELLELRGNGRIDTRICMPEEVYPPGAHRIQIAAPRKILEPHAAAAAYRHERQVFVILHLRARVPDMRQIACDVGRVTFIHEAISRGTRGYCGM